MLTTVQAVAIERAHRHACEQLLCPTVHRIDHLARALYGKRHQCGRGPHLQSVELVVHRGQRYPDIALALQPGRTDGAALAQYHLRHQLKEAGEQQFAGVLLLRHRLEPAVELHCVELSLQHRTHHHRQRWFVHEALQDRAEVHRRLISGWVGGSTRYCLPCSSGAGAPCNLSNSDLKNRFTRNLTFWVSVLPREPICLAGQIDP